MSFSEALNREMVSREWKAAHLLVELDRLGCELREQSVVKWMEGLSIPDLRNGAALMKLFGWTPDDLLAAFEAKAEVSK